MSSQTIVFPDSSRHDDRYDQRPDSPRCTEMIIYITGGAHGIGAATASLAAASGHDVVLLDRDGAAAERHATGLSDLGVKALGLRCDVADEGQVVRAFAEARQLVGQPRGLVTSAGIDRGGSVHEVESSTWDEVIAVNLRGTFLTCREALKAMLTDKGAIVCVASPFALVSAHGVAAYSSSKAGVCALVRSLAVDYADRGIRVNALLPGPTETDLMWSNVARAEIPSMRVAVSRSSAGPARRSDRNRPSGAVAALRCRFLCHRREPALRRRHACQSCRLGVAARWHRPMSPFLSKEPYAHYWN